MFRKRERELIRISIDKVWPYHVRSRKQDAKITEVLKKEKLVLASDKCVILKRHDGYHGFVQGVAKRITTQSLEDTKTLCVAELIKHNVLGGQNANTAITC